MATIGEITRQYGTLMKLAEARKAKPKPPKPLKERRPVDGHFCKGKVKFESPGKADAAIRSLQRRDLAKNDSLNKYKCQRCFSWHIGHSRSDGAGQS